MIQLIAQQQTSPISAFAPLILVFAAMYFLFMRPQQKRARQRQGMLSALEVGDEVVTQSGILGTIIDIDEDEGILSVEIAPGTTVRIVRGGIAQRLVEDENEYGEDEEPEAGEEADEAR